MVNLFAVSWEMTHRFLSYRHPSHLNPESFLLRPDGLTCHLRRCPVTFDTVFRKESILQVTLLSYLSGIGDSDGSINNIATDFCCHENGFGLGRGPHTNSNH